MHTLTITNELLNCLENCPVVACGIGKYTLLYYVQYYKHAFLMHKHFQLRKQLNEVELHKLTNSQSRRKWTQLDTNGHKWTQVDSSGEKWIQVDASGHSWSQVDAS